MDALLRTEIDALVERRVQERVAAVVAEATADLARLRAELDATRAELCELRRRTVETDGSARFAAIYPAFEDRFRGSEVEVRERLAVYLPEVRECVRSGAEGPRVLDIGPGRGEWLAMLAEAGVPACGIDDSAAMVDRLRARGLDVVLADAVDHLETVPAGSLDAVTAFHVVEHLELEPLLALLACARRALRPGGLLVLETPNPRNLVMGACNFHLDPTHRSPLPPAQLRFLAATGGFTEIRIRELHPKEDIDLSGMRVDGVDAAATAMLADALQTSLFGPQDYALLARVPPT